jgi:hypothetical protein
LEWSQPWPCDAVELAGLLPAALDRITELEESRARITRQAETGFAVKVGEVERERDAALESLEEAQGACERQQHLSRIADLAEQLAEAQGKLDAVEEHVMALRPFAAFAVHIDPRSPDDAELLPDLSIAYFRNAKASYDALLHFKECSCGGPSTHPCGPTCKYPYTDESKEGERR